MTLRRIVSLALLAAAGILILSRPALGAPPQNTSGQSGAKRKKALTLQLTGTVSEKGALLMSAADQKIYHVLNSETLKHLEGQLVTLKARLLPEKGQLYVTAVRANSAPAPSDVMARLDDAAFRR